MKHKQLIEDVLKKYDLYNDFPPKYLKVLNKSIEQAFEIFSNNILSITLGGSGGKNHIHEGWSDIDLFIILDNYNINMITKYNKNVNKFNDIYVWTTFYTLKEVKKNMVNLKTKIMIYEKYKYNLNPTLYGDDYFLPITYETVRNNDINNLPNILQEYKKMILDLKIEKIKPSKIYIKKMLLLLKCILNYHNIFSFGYEEAILKFTRLCAEFKFQLTKKSGIDIITIIDDYENIENYKEEIIGFSEEIFDFINQYC